MSAMLVDGNVLLDVITRDPIWSVWSEQVMAEAAETFELVINPIIYAEVSLRFSRIEDLEAALSAGDFRPEAMPFAAALLAGKVFLAYRRRGGVRTAPLPDVFIGAHAAVAGYRLLTRDPRRYRRDFPTVALVSPEAS